MLTIVSVSMLGYHPRSVRWRDLKRTVGEFGAPLPQPMPDTHDVRNSHM